MCGQHNAGRWKKRLGFGLIVLSFLFYGGLAVMPFALLPTKEKVILSSILVVCGEASFFIAVLILGRDAISKYRKLDIHNWLSRRKKDRKPELPQ
jgi:hypothetical protein